MKKIGRQIIKKEEWLAGEIYAGASSITLHHIALENQTTIQSWPVTDEIRENEENVSSLIDTIFGEAQSYCDGLGGHIQRFLIYTQTGNEGKRFAFRLTSNEEIEGDSEPATKAGFLGQVMRHNEALMRMSLQGIGSIVGHLERVCNRQAETVEHLTAQRMEILPALEAAYSDSGKREVEAAQVASAIAMKQEAFKQFSSLLPVLASKFLGTPDVGNTALASVINGFFDSLDDNQKEVLLKTLSKEQLVALDTASKMCHKESGGNGT